jgi:hypothetical protein
MWSEHVVKKHMHDAEWVDMKAFNTYTHTHKQMKLRVKNKK